MDARENVETPAGKFDDCYRLAFYWLDAHQLAWFCPGTGVVRWETHHHGSRHDEVWELQEFHRAASQTALGLVVEEYPIVASGVYTPDRLEYTGYITSTILERRQAWRNPPPVKVVESTNQVLAKFGFRLEPNPIKSNYEYQLYQGNTLAQDQIMGFWPVMVNQRGDDFALLLQTSKGEKLVRRAGIELWDPSQHASTGPILVGNDLVTVDLDSRWKQYAVRHGNKIVYTAPVPRTWTDNPVKGLWAWKGHWVLEVLGQVVIDGKSLNKEQGYDEIFNWRLLNGQPFYFFKKGNRIGVYYAGRVLPYQYDKVIHYQCCEPAVFNVSGNETMVWFHALRDGVWYYVEMGIYPS